MSIVILVVENVSKTLTMFITKVFLILNHKYILINLIFIKMCCLEYSEYLTTYLQKNSNYQPSNDTCFETNVADDLRIFKNGISKEMLNSAYSK